MLCETNITFQQSGSKHDIKLPFACFSLFDKGFDRTALLFHYRINKTLTFIKYTFSMKSCDKGFTIRHYCTLQDINLLGF